MGEVAYRISLPPNMTHVYNAFHLYMLRKYMAEPNHIQCHEVLQIEPRAMCEDIRWVSACLRRIISARLY